MARFNTQSQKGFNPALVVGIIGVGVLVAVLIPLLCISPYNHSYADDWHYGVWAHLALEDSGGNIFAAIAAAIKEVGDTWVDWQGTYSAILIMALEPGVFGEEFYVLAAPIVLATLVAGTLFFAKVVLGERMGAPAGMCLGVACLLIATQLLLLPSPVEGIFWYNSATYYTTFNAAALAYLALVARICDPAQESLPRKAIIGQCLLAAFVAGGNFVTVLVVFEVMVVVLAHLFYERRRCATDVLCGFSVFAVGFIVSFIAPGNDVRQQTQFPEDSAGVWGTIWQSSVAAFQYIQQWSTGLVFLLVVACIPIAVYVGHRAVERGFTFKWPALVAIGSVALFATSFTPTFWAEGSVGPGRVQNCRFEIYLILLLLNVFWTCGWLCAHNSRGEVAKDSGAKDSVTFLHPAISVRLVALWFGCAALVYGCTIGAMAFDEDLGEDLSSVSAARSVISGEAQDYHQQVLDRLETIENSTEDLLRVPYYTNVPHVLLMGDIRDNMDNYINYRLCQWYGKESIIGYSAPKTQHEAVGVYSD